jgi:hypothetical protein
MRATYTFFAGQSAERPTLLLLDLRDLDLRDLDLRDLDLRDP